MNATAPQNTDAERALLGGLMTSPECFEDIADKVTPDAFYRPDNGRLFSLLRDMRRDGEVIELVTVSDRISRAGGFDRFGGFTHVTSHADYCPSTANLDHYARIIAAEHRRRLALRALTAAEERIRAATDVNAEIAAVASEMGATVDTGNQDDWIWYAEASTAAIDAAQDASKPGAVPKGLLNPLDAWYRLIPRFTKGDVHIIAARPSMGKTALARRVAEAAGDYGREMGEACAVFSLEDSPEVFASATMASFAEVSMADFEAGRLDQRAWREIDTAHGMAHDLPIAISRSKNMTIGQLVARAHGLRRQLERKGTKLNALFVDHIGLLKREAGDGRRNPNEIVGDQSRELKLLAMALDVPLILLVQLNRASERDERPPNMTDLRDSGRIEEDATTITFVNRDKSDPDNDTSRCDLIVAKNKRGPCGVAQVLFHGPTLTFSDPMALHPVVR